MNLENAINLGKHWAAIRGDQAIAVIPMTIPKVFPIYQPPAIIHTGGKT